MSKIQVREYDLSDSYLYKDKPDNISVKVWIPDKTCIVLGRSNNAEDSLIQENIIKDGIPVYKRPSGGETVVLSPKTIVISIAIHQEQFKGGKKYFRNINEAIIQILSNHQIKSLNYKGISDIAIGDMKILGSALYQNKDVVFYHAVLNFAESPKLFDLYLKYPQREPDYREGRKHSDFVTSLLIENYNHKIDDIVSSLEQGLQNIIFNF